MATLAVAHVASTRRKRQSCLLLRNRRPQTWSAKRWYRREEEDCEPLHHTMLEFLRVSAPQCCALSSCLTRARDCVYDRVLLRQHPVCQLPFPSWRTHRRRDTRDVVSTAKLRTERTQSHFRPSIRNTRRIHFLERDKHERSVVARLTMP